MGTKPIVQQFTDDIVDVVNKYRDQGITHSEVVGSLELVKMDVMMIAMRGREDWDD